MSENRKSTSIALNASVYETYKTRPNTISHALGEFVDNAIASYLRNKDRLIENDPTYKLRIDIEIEWEDKKTSRITIKTMLLVLQNMHIKQHLNRHTNQNLIKV